MMTEARPTKILHIDDDESFLEYFRNTYGDEFAIVSVNGGNDVPEIVSRQMPDALVLDFELPGRNGLELLAAIKENHPSLPVIFYTGQGNEEIARQAFREGASDYFVKRASDFAQKEKLVNSIQKALEKKAVEEELAEKQAMLEGIIDLNPYSINIIDENGLHVRVNKAFLELWGTSCPPDVNQMKQVENYGDNYKILNDQLRSGGSIKYPHIWMDPKDFHARLIGNKVCVGSMAFSIKNKLGKPKYYIIMHEDITARVEAEEALRNAHQDLTVAHEALRAAYESVEQKVAERTAELEEANRKLQAEIDERRRLQIELEKQNTELESFSHTVSHDLRNNLLVMQRLMEKGGISPESISSIHQTLIENTGHMQQFVERLLFLAQAGRAISKKQIVSLEEAAGKAFSMTAASQGDAELCIDLPFPAVHCDPGAFEQIFSNLFSNSLSHAQPDSKPVIRVGCAINDGTAVITVSDNGKGIEPGVVPKIFDSTFTTNRKEHFGLDLAIVKKLVEAHGGNVRAESDGPGKGASFIITIPNRLP